MLGGVVNKHVSVERLRHSISVARGHQPANSPKNIFSSGSSSSGNSASGAVPQGNIGNYQGKSNGSGAGRGVLVRRHSGHSSVSDGGGWAGVNQGPSYKFSVEPAGSGVGAVGEVGVRPRGIRPAQQVF